MSGRSLLEIFYIPLTLYSLIIIYHQYCIGGTDSRTKKTIVWDSLARSPLEILHKPLTLYSLIILYHLHCIGGTGKRRKLQCGTETADMSGEIASRDIL